MNDKPTPLEMACREIEDKLGSCPLDMYDEEPESGWDCENKCEELMDKIWVCWKVYFIRRAREEEGGDVS